jgi:triacylglycerol lipase
MAIPAKYTTNPFAKFTYATTRWQPLNALALAWACDLAYEVNVQTISDVANAWGFQLPQNAPPTADGPRDIRGYVMGNDDFIVVAFRGTVNEMNGRFDANNWVVNLEANQVSVEPVFGIRGNVHEGFATALSSIWPAITNGIDELQTKRQSVWFTGHSLGGALALMGAATQTFELRQPFNGLYTFGQPRVGDPDFCGACDTHFGDQYFRFVNNEDIVTRIPPRIFPHFPLPDIYGHGGQLAYFDASGNLHNDEHYWNSFLTGVEVGLQGMQQIAGGALVADHDLEKGYIANVQKYVIGGCNPAMQW